MTGEDVKLYFDLLVRVWREPGFWHTSTNIQCGWK